MDMRDEWIAGLKHWAAGNDSVRELWLFGSRAKETSRDDSDIDIALETMPRHTASTTGPSPISYSSSTSGRPSWVRP